MLCRNFFITFYNLGNNGAPNKIIDLKLDGVSLDATSLEERNYYIEAISFGHAHLAADVDFLCPIPKPHTCYFNFSGNTMIRFESLVYIPDQPVTQYGKHYIFS